MISIYCLLFKRTS